MVTVSLVAIYNRKMNRAAEFAKLQAVFLLAPSERNLEMLTIAAQEYQDASWEMDDIEAHDRETLHQYALLKSK